MPRIDTTAKLQKMYELFTTHDDGKLTSGEVEALAGFNSGLPAAGKANAKEQLVSIFQSADYTPGIKAKFKKALLAAGLTDRDLAAVAPGGLNAVDKQRLATKIGALSDDGSGTGVTKELSSMAKLRWEVQPQLQEAVEALKASKLARSPDASFGDMLIKAIYEQGSNGRAGALVGDTVELGIYADDHDVDERLTFSKTGVQVAQDYVGE